MTHSDSLVVGDTKYTFNTPQLQVSSSEAREQCQLQKIQLATIKDGDQFARIARHVEKYHGIYDIWHVGTSGKSAFIYLNMNKKFINKFFENGNNLRVVERHSSVALYTFVNQSDFDSKKVGNYICMSKTQNVEASSTENYDGYDEATTSNSFLKIFSYIYDNFHNNSTTELNLHNNDNSINFSGEFHGFRHQTLGITVGIMLFVVVLVFATLHFVFRKKNSRNNFK